MSTRSTISILRQNGTLSSIYCHWDGYFSYNGAILLTFYKNVEKVKELIELGDISTLDENIGVAIDFDDSKTRTKNKQVLAYKRDGHEDETGSVDYKSLDSFIESGNLQEFDYVFDEQLNAWYYIDGTELKRLTKKLVKE